MKFKVKLRLIDASGKKHKYSLNLEEGSKFTLGRGTPGIGAELNHPTVSTAHCHLTINGGVLHVMDNKSRNGTKLNGKALQTSAVRVGDMLQLGVCQIEFLEAPNPPIEENPASTQFIDINELSPEEAKALGKSKPDTRAPEPTMAMSRQGLARELAQNDSSALSREDTNANRETGSMPAPNENSDAGIQDEASMPAPEAAPAPQPADPNAAAYGVPPNPFAPAADPTPIYGEETQAMANALGLRSPDSFGRNRESEYRREDDPRYSSLRGSRRGGDSDSESRSTRRPASRGRDRDRDDERQTQTSTKSRKSSSNKKSQFDSHVPVSVGVTLVSMALAGSIVSMQKGSYSPLVTLISGVLGSLMVAGLAQILHKYNEFIEAEGETRDYFRFLAFSSVALIPASMLTSSAIIFRLAAFIGLGVAFFHFFMAKFRPVAEKFVFLVGSYVCTLTFLGYMVGGQLNGISGPQQPQVGPKQPVVKNQTPEREENEEEEEDRAPANDPEQTPPPPQQTQQPVQQPTATPVQSPTQAPAPVNTTAAQQPVQQPTQTSQKNTKPGPDSFAISQLYKAAESGDTDIVRKLIRDKGVNPNTVAENGVTALMLASYYGRADTAKFLLSEKADINLRDKQGTTALMWAVLKGNREMVILLVRAGANLTARRNDGDTALDIARLWHYEDITRILEDPDRAKKGLAYGSASNTRRPSSQPQSTRRVQPQRKPSTSKKATKKKKGARYSATEDEDD